MKWKKSEKTVVQLRATRQAWQIGTDVIVMPVSEGTTPQEVVKIEMDVKTGISSTMLEL